VAGCRTARTVAVESGLRQMPRHLPHRKGTGSSARNRMTGLVSSLGGNVPTARQTLAKLKRWPATVSVEEAATALGIGRSTAYELLRRGEFPAATITCGSRKLVLTSSLLSLLEPGAVR
jgi:excisionase family DNA binding protein